MNAAAAGSVRSVIEAVVPMELRPMVTGYLEGRLAAGVALLRALLSGVDPDRLAVVVDGLAAELASRSLPDAADRCRRLARAMADNAAGCAAIAAIHRIGGPEPDSSDADARIAAWATLFDRYAQEDDVVSVAGYTLGDAALLAASTAEVVELLLQWGVIAPDRDVLQIGCGTGRFEVALAPRVRRACGIDISGEMIRRARQRCAGLGNVHVAVASGTSLRDFADGEFHLVYAVDSLPYVHEAGPELLDRVFDEMHRVLAPGGHAAIFNLCYGSSRSAERAQLDGLAGQHAFAVLVDGITPFTSWDGAAYLLRRRP